MRKFLAGFVALCAGLAPAGLSAQAVLPEVLRIDHSAVAAFRHGEKVTISARTAGARWMRFFFRGPGVSEFQVRPMAEAGAGQFAYALDTGEIAGAAFEYYLEAGTNDKTAVLPAGAPAEFLAASAEEGEAIPVVPEDLPPPEAPKAKAAFPVDLTGTVQAALLEEGGSTPARDIPASGNMRLAANYAKGDFGLMLDGNFNYSNIPVPGEREFDLSNLAFSVTRKKHALRAGDLNITESEFTIQGLGRRGLEYAYGGERSSVHVFDVSSQQPRGFDGFGPPKSSLGILGGSLGWRLLGNAVSLKAVYLSGKDDPRRGVNVAQDYFLAAGRKGSVMALVEETSLFGDRLTIGGEFARSDYDGDIRDGGGSRADNAWRIAGAFRSGLLQVGAAYRHIGNAFNSIGHAYFANDRRGLEANLGLTKGRFQLAGTFLSVRDNVEGEADRDTTENLAGNLNALWSVSDKLSFNAGYQRSRQNTFRDLGTPLFPQDSLTDQLSGAFQWTVSPSASLQLQVARTSLSSASTPQADNSGLAVNWGGAFRAGNRFSIAPTLGFQRGRNVSSGEIQRTFTSFMTAEATILPEWLSTSFQGGYSRTDGGTAGIGETLQFSGWVNLQLKKLIRIGNAVLSIRGNHGRTKLTGFSSNVSSILAQCDFSF
ncbi:MAG: hypothetical protein ACYDH0_08245 [Candidatus Aminicenantales bacterium]